MHLVITPLAKEKAFVDNYTYQRNKQGTDCHVGCTTSNLSTEA